MLSSIEMLNQRVQILEKTYFGIDRTLSPSQDSILEKVQGVSSKLERIEQEVPEFKACHELVTQFRPLLLEKKNSAVGIMQSVEALIANKEALQQQMRQLVTIDELSHVINNEHYRGTGVYMPRTLAP
jgi:archaellum component FlaC